MTAEHTPCCVETCRPIKASHLPECPQAGCRGCAPRLAEPGQLVCPSCRLRAADRLTALGLPNEFRTDDRYEERDPVTGDVIAKLVRHREPRSLPSLYDAVLDPAKVPTQGGGAKPSDAAADDTQVADHGSPQACREAIGRLLRTWSLWLNDGTHYGAPTTDIPGLTRHILDGLGQILCSGPDTADQLVHDIDQAYASAYRCAYPSPPAGQALGACPDCGTVVRSADLHGWVPCRGCGTVRTVDEWRALIVGELSEGSGATAADLVSWLTARHHRPVTHTTIRQWASAGVKVAGVPVKLARLGTDERGRALYSVADASRIATHLYGPARAIA